MKLMKLMHRMQHRQLRRTTSMRPQRSACPRQRCRHRRHMRQDKGRARQTSPDRLYACEIPLSQIGVIVSTLDNFVNEFRLAPVKYFAILFHSSPRHHGDMRPPTAHCRIAANICGKLRRIPNLRLKGEALGHYPMQTGRICTRQSQAGPLPRHAVSAASAGVIGYGPANIDRDTRAESRRDTHATRRRRCNRRALRARKPRCDRALLRDGATGSDDSGTRRHEPSEIGRRSRKPRGPHGRRSRARTADNVGIRKEAG